MEQEQVPATAEKNPTNVSHAYHEVYDEAREQFYTQQENNNKEKIESIKTSILEETKGRAQDSVPEGSARNSFTPVKEQPKTSGVRRMATALGIAIAGLFPMKEAQGQQKVQHDKEGITKEVMATTPEMQKLTDKQKEDWNAYIDWLDSKKLKGNPQLNNKAFSDQMMGEFNSIDTNRHVSREMVKSVQYELKNYQAKVNELEKEAELKGGTIIAGAVPGTKNITIMEGLDKTAIDGYAGEHTTQFKFPRYIVNTIHKEYLKSPVGNRIELVSNETKKTEDKGFATPDIGSQ